jgi:hypothetical protein
METVGRPADTGSMTDYDALLNQAITLACHESQDPSEELILVWFYRLLIEGGYVTVH